MKAGLKVYAPGIVLVLEALTVPLTDSGTIAVMARLLALAVALIVSIHEKQRQRKRDCSNDE